MPLVVRSTASSALDQLIKRINATTGIPVVHDPQMNYEDCAKEYRRNADRRYRHQVDQVDGPDEDLTSSLIGWSRQAMRYPKDSSGQRSNTLNCVCPELDANGAMTGNGIAWTGLRGEFLISFRLYSTDVREIERFEILYMSKNLVSNIVQQTFYLKPYVAADGSDALTTEQSEGSCMTVDMNYEWDFQSTNLQFQREENQYIQFDFECYLRGPFLASTGTSETIINNPDGSTTVGKITYVMEVRGSRHIRPTNSIPR